MHVLIQAVGSAGDVHPFLAIGQALVARGHAVDILTSAYFAERVQQAGLGFIPAGSVEDYQRAIAQPDLWHPRNGFKVLWQESKSHVLPCYELLRQHVRPDTVILGSTLAWSARLAQEKLGMPGATVHLSPTCIFSAIAPARYPGIGAWFEYLPVSWRRGFLAWLERRFLDGVVQDEFNALRAQIGLAPVRKIMSNWSNSPQSVICAFPDWFCAPQADWPANSVTTGFPLWPSFPRRRESSGVSEPTVSAHAVLAPLDSRLRGNDGWGESASEGLDAALESFLAGGDAPVGFTPGSAMAFGKPFFERALAACTALGRRAVFITPFEDQLPWTSGDAPACIHHERYVPFDALIPRLAALVHHGGIGTTAQAMHAGVPQLITPFAHDQFDNAARAMQMGCGTSLQATASAAKWSRALMRLLTNPETAMACRQVRACMADQAQVMANIVAQVEQLAIKP